MAPVKMCRKRKSKHLMFKVDANVFEGGGDVILVNIKKPPLHTNAFFMSQSKFPFALHVLANPRARS
jgi:hypothetical protein